MINRALYLPLSLNATRSLADRCQRRDSGIKCLRRASSKGGQGRPQKAASANDTTGMAGIGNPATLGNGEWRWASIHRLPRSFAAPDDGRRTCQSPTWQPADYTSHTIAIGIARGHGDTVIISRAKERKKRKSNLERERVRDNANK